MSNAASVRRFSLLSLVLLVTTLAAMAGWIGALRQTNEARRETLTLRRELEHYRAELGELQVADKTRVHAIGLRRDPQDQLRWKWRVYLPRDFEYRLVLQTDQRQSTEILPVGQLVVEAQLAPGSGDTWRLNLAVDGDPRLSAAVPWYTPNTKLRIPRYVGPNERSVWEQAERPLLIEARNASEDAPDHSDPSGTNSDGLGFAIWIETKVDESSQPPGG